MSTRTHPKGRINRNPATRDNRPIKTPEQMTFTVQPGKGYTGGRGYRNGLEETPYLPKDPERRERLLAAIETINRDRAASTS